jgi:peptidyl-prolyl cis-trans isomerase C
MYGSTRLWFAIFMLAGLAGIAQGQQPPATTAPAQTAPPKEELTAPWPTGIAATVNGQPLTEAAVQRALLTVPKDRREQVRADKVQYLIDIMLTNQYLQQENPPINQKEVDDQLNKIREEIKKRGGEVEKELRSIFATEEDVKNEIVALLRWESFLNKRATEAALKDLLAKEPELVDGTTVRARHILITPASNDPKLGEQAQADLKQMKLDIEKKVAAGLTKLPKNSDNLARERERCKLIDEAFADMARDKSSCPSKSVGGDVGSFPRCGSMVEPFAKAAFALKPFQMSEVVKTQFGYHLILVTERKPGTPVKFEEVQTEIKDVYGYRLQHEIVAQLREQSKIVVNPPPARPTTEAAPKQ